MESRQEQTGVTNTAPRHALDLEHTSNVDTTSPYYLHASDNPGQLYVSELLHDGNYGEWVNDMSNALFAKNKIGFVDGSIPMPAADDVELSRWMRCNAMVKGWLKSAMRKDTRSSVRYAETAQAIWRDLEERFGKENAPRAYELRQTIGSLRQEGLSIPAYYTKLRSLWDEASSISPLPRCTCEGCKCDLQQQLRAVKEKEQLYDFLMGLEDHYATIKTQILSMKPTPTLGMTYHLVTEDEQRHVISATRRPINVETESKTTPRLKEK